MKIHP